MAKNYTSTVPLAFRRQHTCVTCGTKYSYEIRRVVSGTGTTPEHAAEAAKKAAKKTLHTEVEAIACPTCGLVQPDMKAKLQTPVFWMAVACSVIGVGIAMVLGSNRWTSLAMSASIGVIASLAGLAVNVAGAFRDPNRNLEANAEAVARKVADGAVGVDERPTTRPGPVHDPGAGLGAAKMIGLALACVAPLLAGAPEILRVASGWKTNAGSFPEVAGPGDTVRLYFNDKISSVQGMWHGNARATVTGGDVEAGDGPLSFPARTKSSSWGEKITGKSVANRSSRIWSEVSIPDDARFAGKTVRLDLAAAVRFPSRLGQNFIVDEKEFYHAVEMTLAAPRAGATYTRAWWGGQIGAILSALAALGLMVVSTRGLRAKALATGVGTTA